jgi:hypothetical protein
MRAAGAEQISDHFIVPVTDGHPRKTARAARRQRLCWREHTGECWLRVADVPFDLLPVRHGTAARRAALFSLGPGLDMRGCVHPAVLLLQIEGSDETVIVELGRILPVTASVAQELQMVAQRDTDSGWLRICVAGLVSCI